MTFLWVVGAPGVGKTTFLREFVESGSTFLASPKWTIGEKLCLAGHYVGGTFDGADTVPYNGVKTALSYWDEFLSKKKVTVFDGDRFSNANVVYWALTRGDVRVMHFTASAHTLQVRRLLRGSTQNASWMLGRKTKSARFTESFDEAKRVYVDVDSDAAVDAAKSLIRGLLT